ncbi:MAG: E3 binding domain-containing protein [Propionibacteriaceae bacterium]|nr:E3 binding domain-containing protein [Propionibacteriaceae bacterium]
MAEVVVMPLLGSTVETCLIVAWRVDVGDRVEPTTPICDIETDQATALSLPARASGVVFARLGQAGQEVPVKAPLLIVGQSDEDVRELLVAHGLAAPAAPPPGATVSDPSAPPVAASAAMGEQLCPEDSPPSPPVSLSARVAAIMGASNQSSKPAPGLGDGPGVVGQTEPLSERTTPIVFGPIESGPVESGSVESGPPSRPGSPRRALPDEPWADGTGTVQSESPQSELAQSGMAQSELPQSESAQSDTAQSEVGPTSDRGRAEGREGGPADSPSGRAARVTGSDRSGSGRLAPDGSGPTPTGAGTSTGPVPTARSRRAGAGPAAASPRARELAAVYGLSVDALIGTGPRGRVIERDVLAAISGQALPSQPAPPVEQPAVGGPSEGLEDETKTDDSDQAAPETPAAKLTDETEGAASETEPEIVAAASETGPKGEAGDESEAESQAGAEAGSQAEAESQAGAEAVSQGEAEYQTEVEAESQAEAEAVGAEDVPGGEGAVSSSEPKAEAVESAAEAAGEAATAGTGDDRPGSSAEPPEPPEPPEVAEAAGTAEALDQSGRLRQSATVSPASPPPPDDATVEGPVTAVVIAPPSILAALADRLGSLAGLSVKPALALSLIPAPAAEAVRRLSQLVVSLTGRGETGPERVDREGQSDCADQSGQPDPGGQPGQSDRAGWPKPAGQPEQSDLAGQPDQGDRGGRDGGS